MRKEIHFLAYSAFSKDEAMGLPKVLSPLYPRKKLLNFFWGLYKKDLCISFMCRSVLPALYVCASHSRLVPVEARRRCRIPWAWSYRVL